MSALAAAAATDACCSGMGLAKCRSDIVQEEHGLCVFELGRQGLLRCMQAGLRFGDRGSSLDIALQGRRKTNLIALLAVLMFTVPLYEDRGQAKQEGASPWVDSRLGLLGLLFFLVLGIVLVSASYATAGA